MKLLGCCLLICLAGSLCSANAASPNRDLPREVLLCGRHLDPLLPPLGFKTYTDLGLLVDDTMLATAAQPESAAVKPLPHAAERVFPLFDQNARLKLGLGGEPEGRTPARFDSPQILWCAYSKDRGRTWSEPRFIACVLTTNAPALQAIEFRKEKGKALSLAFPNASGAKCVIRFKEDDLCRLATADDLQRAPAGAFVLQSAPPGKTNLLAETICVGGDQRIETARPPAGYVVSPECGLLLHQTMRARVLHRALSKTGRLNETRALVTPKGDYLVLIPDGDHANSPRQNANRLYAYRSSDRGQTWSGPAPLLGEGKHHALLPVVPRGSSRIYLFETLRGPASQPAKGDRAFGSRYSDDDGRTWSPAELIQTAPGAYVGGTCVIQMTESSAGTWLVGYHHAHILRGELAAARRQWSVIANEQNPPRNAFVAAYSLDEFRVLALSGPNVLALARTCEGHLWELRSADDGRTWSDPHPTPLVHPDAPPMLFHLSDGKTLIALHHNRAVARSVHEPIHSQWLALPTPGSAQIAAGNELRHVLKDWVSRAEIWFSLSHDDGAHWSEPRLLFANALAETLPDVNPDYNCSYVDLLVDQGQVHLFVPHRWNRIVHLSFPEDQLRNFATKETLRRTQISF